MSDLYQATYDAVRSKIRGGDISEAVAGAVRDVNMGHYVDQAYTEVKNAGYEMQRPSAIYRPVLAIDGNQWCALYGANLQEGVAGFGDSPALAMYDFDKAWITKLAAKTA